MLSDHCFTMPHITYLWPGFTTEEQQKIREGTHDEKANFWIYTKSSTLALNNIVKNLIKYLMPIQLLQDHCKTSRMLGDSGNINPFIKTILNDSGKI